MGFASLTAADLIAFGEKVGLPSPAAEVDMTLAAKIEDDVFLVTHLGRVARRHVGAGRAAGVSLSAAISAMTRWPSLPHQNGGRR
jgi:hypothetical protein